MAALKALKERRNSIRSTRRIVSTMKMISATKLHRMESKLFQLRQYSSGITDLLKYTLSTTSAKHSLLLDSTGDLKNILLLVVTSDRGLCGGLNTVLLRRVLAYVSDLENDGKNVVFYVVGNKGISFIKRHFSSYQINSFPFDVPSLIRSREHIKLIISLLGKIYDRCFVFYNRFLSVLHQEPTCVQFIPFVDSQTNVSTICVEPKEDILLETLLPNVLSVRLYEYLLENFISEFASRMTAMDNATINADKLIDSLTLTYNRTRQAHITKELIEIMSGAESLKGE